MFASGAHPPLVCPPAQGCHFTRLKQETFEIANFSFVTFICETGSSISAKQLSPRLKFNAQCQWQVLCLNEIIIYLVGKFHSLLFRNCSGGRLLLKRGWGSTNKVAAIAIKHCQGREAKKELGNRAAP